MPYSTVQQLAAAIESAGTAIAGSQTEALNRAALKLKRSVEASRDRVTGDGRLSGVGNARLGVRYDIKGSTNPTALLRVTGPWQLIERDTRPAGRVTGKVGRVRGGRRVNRERNVRIAFGARGALSGVRPMRTPWGPKSAIQDRGTRGQHPFKKGVEAGTKPALQELRGVVVKAVGRAISGR